MALTEFITFAVAIVVLMEASKWLVYSLRDIARLLRKSEFYIGAVILALSTSAPELFVSLSATYLDKPNIVLGNVIGSNIADATFVIGVVAMIARNLKISKEDIMKSAQVALFFSAALFLVIIDGQISRLEGALLILMYIAYIKKFIPQGHHTLHLTPIQARDAIKAILIFPISLAVLFISSNYVIETTINIAKFFGVPEIFIALTLISLGTSFPELVIETRAALAKKNQILFGDLLGSIITNSTLVIGVAAIQNPIPSGGFVPIQALVMVFAVSMLYVFMHSEWDITWHEGYLTLFFYVILIVFEALLFVK